MNSQASPAIATHITGPNRYALLTKMAPMGAADDWRQFVGELQFGFPDEFYFFERDPHTGLCSDEANRAYLKSKRKRRTELPVPLGYRFSRRVHDAVFAADAPLAPAGRRLYESVERKPRPVRRALHVLEQAVKVPAFHCRDLRRR